MDSQDGGHSAGYHSYASNKALHFADTRGVVRGSFMKSASSSQLTKTKQTEDHHEQLDLTGEAILPSMLVRAPEPWRFQQSAGQENEQRQAPKTNQPGKNLGTKNADQGSQAKRKSSPFRSEKPLKDKIPASAEKYTKSSSHHNIFQTSERRAKNEPKLQNKETVRVRVDFSKQLSEARKLLKTTVFTTKSPLIRNFPAQTPDSKRVSPLFSSSQSKTKPVIKSQAVDRPKPGVGARPAPTVNVHDRLYSLRNRRRDGPDEVEAKVKTPSTRLRGKETSNPRMKAPIWRPVSRKADLQMPESVFMTKISDQKNNSRAYSSTASEEFFQRNLAWLQTRQEKTQSNRQAKAESELRECTFWPQVYEPIVHQPTPDLCWGMGPTENDEHRVVIEGRTYELAKGGELQEFLMKSISKSGQRSIFRRNNEAANKVYQHIMK